MGDAKIAVDLVFSPLDYILFSSMFVISAGIGVYFGCFGSKQASIKEYLLGGKTMSVFPIAMSLVASNLSGVALLGIPSELYMYGTQYWSCMICNLVVTLSLFYIYLPVFYKLQLNSSYEYLKLRFNSKLRSLVSIIFVIDRILYIPIVIYIPALAFNQVTGLNIHYITPIICGVCIFYTTVGGLKAVVWSDTFQILITMGSIIAVFCIDIGELGGIGPIWDRAYKSDRIEFFNLNPDPTERSTFWGITIGLSTLWIAHGGINQACIQRYLSLPSLKAAQNSVITYGVAVVFTKSLSCLCGLIIYSKYYDCDPITAGKVKRTDQLLPYYVLDVASKFPGLSGIFISGVFSTALSTMSTSLNTLAGTIYEDFLLPSKKIKVDENNGNSVMKIIVVVTGFICVGLVFMVEHLGAVLQMSISFSGITGGALLGVFTLGMLFPVANSKGALWGSLVSMAFCAWMAIGHQIHNYRGNIIYEPKPLSINGCEPYRNLTQDLVNINNTKTEEPLWLYKVSFYWFGFVGFVIVLITGLIISYITDNEDEEAANIDLFSPCIHKFVSKGNAKNVNEVTSTLLKI